MRLRTSLKKTTINSLVAVSYYSNLYNSCSHEELNRSQNIEHLRHGGVSQILPQRELVRKATLLPADTHLGKPKIAAES